MKVGPYDVHLVGGKVASVSLNLTPDQPSVTVKGQVVTPKSPEDLARHLGTCGPLQMNIGGNVIQCASGAIAGQHLGGLSIHVTGPNLVDDAPTCAGYLVPGEAGSKLVIEAGQTYCVGTRVLTRDVRQPDVLGRLAYNTCQVKLQRGRHGGDVPVPGRAADLRHPERPASRATSPYGVQSGRQSR
ncbi:MAG: hypothetical protein R3F60_18625 [bacterium]